MSEIVPTSKANIDRINKLAADLQPLMLKLADQWRTNKDTTDNFNYLATITKQVPKWAEVTALATKPFGIQFLLSNNAVYKIEVIHSRCAWKRVG